MNTFVDGLRRVLNCSKVHVAASGLATTWVAVRYAAESLPPTQRAALWIAFVGAVALQLREIINAWAEEDVARANNSSAPPAPMPRLPVPQPRPQSSQPAPPRPASPVASLPDASRPPVSRSLQMPSRTKLPILIVFSTIASVSGCGACPELAMYRDGLWRVDEPMYQSHLLLLDDAVAARLRTDADREVIKQGINSAKALHAQGALAR